jgi:hypothetical protein
MLPRLSLGGQGSLQLAAQVRGQLFTLVSAEQM